RGEALADMDRVVRVAAGGTQAPFASREADRPGIAADDEAAGRAVEGGVVAVALRAPPIAEALAPKVEEARLVHAHIDGRDGRALAGPEIGRVSARHRRRDAQKRRRERLTQPIEDRLARQAVVLEARRD